MKIKGTISYAEQIRNHTLTDYTNTEEDEDDDNDYEEDTYDGI